MLFLRGLVGYLAVLLVLVGAMQGGALGAARLLGLPRFRWFAPRPAEAPWWRRLAVRATSSLAPLLVCVGVLWAALFFAGESVTTTTVVVLPGPAEEAGLVNGDRIVSIDGKLVDSFEAIRAAVKAGHGDERIEIERSGERRVLVVHPTPGGQIGVHATYRQQAVGALRAARAAVATPGNVYLAVMKGILHSADEPVTLSGPVGVVHATEGQKDPGSFLTFLGIFGSYVCLYLWAVHVFDALTLLLFARTHPSAAGRAEPEATVRLCRLHQALTIAVTGSLAFLLLAMLLQLPLVSAVVAPLVILSVPAAVALYPLVWLTARERWHQSAAWVAPSLAIGTLVPCVGQAAALELVVWLRKELKSRGYALGWFVALRPDPEP